jgi:flavin-binding protein dodecin
VTSLTTVGEVRLRASRPIVGSSKENVDDAIRGAVERASKTLRNLDWFKLSEIWGHIDNGRVCHFQITRKVGLRLEEPS